MRIDRLELPNFKMFAEATFEFPRSLNGPPDGGSFHVLIGENGTGKTSILDAAVALGGQPQVSLGDSLPLTMPGNNALVGHDLTYATSFCTPL